MRSHNDFKDLINMPNYFIKSSVPKFQILKSRVRKIVLLIDKALRLEPENKFVKLEKVRCLFYLVINNLQKLILISIFKSILLTNKRKLGS